MVLNQFPFNGQIFRQVNKIKFRRLGKLRKYENNSFFLHYFCQRFQFTRCCLRNNSAKRFFSKSMYSIESVTDLYHIDMLLSTETIYVIKFLCQLIQFFSRRFFSFFVFYKTRLAKKLINKKDLTRKIRIKQISIVPALVGSECQQAEDSLLLLDRREDENRQTDLLELDKMIDFCFISQDSLIESGFPGLILFASNHDIIYERLSAFTNQPSSENPFMLSALSPSPQLLELGLISPEEHSLSIEFLCLITLILYLLLNYLKKLRFQNMINLLYQVLIIQFLDIRVEKLLRKLIIELKLIFFTFEKKPFPKALNFLKNCFIIVILFKKYINFEF